MRLEGVLIPQLEQVKAVNDFYWISLSKVTVSADVMRAHR
ncbi:hypothetical protein XF_1988 [Xylella fastidiosa 9a5c]|uniref:Uncharacterized protein n=1 Tax=Xylella fastidiosa (strain 9a5c) TaxID=160492 RepID=Q9PBZ7_XYLFA|nr:hypothetical protein XF_1988 [Xylella fastidiosa 9a5c]